MRGRGVTLLGLDLPSVDALDSKELRNHHALAAADIAIVEGLDLGAVEAGVYLLAALPLKIIGGDGAPVRAILWREE
jgi:arylformamidase